MLLATSFSFSSPLLVPFRKPDVRRGVNWRKGGKKRKEKKHLCLSNRSGLGRDNRRALIGIFVNKKKSGLSMSLLCIVKLIGRGNVHYYEIAHTVLYNSNTVMAVLVVCCWWFYYCVTMQCIMCCAVSPLWTRHDLFVQIIYTWFEFSNIIYISYMHWSLCSS